MRKYHLVRPVIRTKETLCGRDPGEVYYLSSNPDDVTCKVCLGVYNANKEWWNLLMDKQQPCRIPNTVNVCVAEGCYNYACLKVIDEAALAQTNL